MLPQALLSLYMSHYFFPVDNVVPSFIYKYLSINIVCVSSTGDGAENSTVEVSNQAENMKHLKSKIKCRTKYKRQKLQTS